MIETGLVSITFRQLQPERIVELVQQARLNAIEWGGDIHVPHGDIPAARRVKQLTRDAGLKVSAYGSYYRVAFSEQQGLEFNQVLDSALELAAPTIRVWAGKREPQDADQDYYRHFVDETRRIADLAQDHNIALAFEYHGGTLTSSAESTRQLLEMINHPNVATFWQPIHGAGPQSNGQDLAALLPNVSNIHVFHWWPDHLHRHLLEDGKQDWLHYVSILQKDNRDRFAGIEFVKEDKEENFLADARTLREIFNNA